MVEDHPEDGRKKPLGMPSMKQVKDRNELKNPHKSREYAALGRFLRLIVFVPVSALITIVSLILWPSVPPVYQNFLYSVPYWVFEWPGEQLHFAYFAPVTAFFIVCVVLLWKKVAPWAASSRSASESKPVEGTAQTTLGAKKETGPGHEQGTPSLTSGSEGANPSAPPSSLPDAKISCRLCPWSGLSKYIGWFEVVEHLKTHRDELEWLFGSLPDQVGAQELLARYFEEK